MEIEVATENKIETPLGRKTRSSSRRKVEPAVEESYIDVQIEQLTDSDLEIEEVTNMYEDQNQKVKRDGSEPFSLSNNRLSVTEAEMFPPIPITDLKESLYCQ